MLSRVWSNKIMRKVACNIFRIVFSLFLFAVIFSYFPIQRTDATLTSGELDTTFGNDKTSTHLVDGSDLSAVAIQDDGKILLGGSYYFGYESDEECDYYRLLRLKRDGSLDESFASIGMDNLDGSVLDIGLQPDGKILVGGDFTQYGELFTQGIMRLNSDGSFDNSFVTGAGFNDEVSLISVSDDGVIYVEGYFTEYDGVAVGNLVRLNLDGSLDTSFVSSVPTSYNWNDLLLQDDGKVLVNYWDDSGVRPEYGILRLNTDGSIDTSFDLSYFYSKETYSVALQSNGKILLGGIMDISDNGIDDSFAILRINNDGSLDESFTPTRIGTDDNISSIALQSNGKILISGSISEYGGESVANIVRLNTNGSLDASFGSISGELYIGGDDRIFVHGSFWNYEGYPCPGFVSFDSEGNVEDTFMWKANGFNSGVNDIEIQPDGKILVVQSYISNTLENYFTDIVRLNHDGTIDTSFLKNSIAFEYNARVSSIEVLSNGKILLGGFSGLWDREYFLLRLNADGSQDESFVTLEWLEEISKIEELSNGKLLIGIESSPSIILLNEDGSLDTSFVTDPESSYSDYHLTEQGDGKIITLKYLDGMDSTALVRLNQDGSEDPTFNVLGASFDNMLGSVPLLVQDDGKIIASGNITLYGDDVISNIVRLNSDGTLDSSFANTSGLWIDVYALQDDGKIIAYAYDEELDSSFMVRLNSDGSIDESFVPYLWNGSVYATKIQSNGDILVGGRNYSGGSYLFRLNIHHQSSVSESQVDGVVNPTNLLNSTPKFSARISDENVADTISQYQIQVNTNSLFTGTIMWDSGVKTFATSVSNNTRTPDISYAGTALTLEGTKYYWRMRVWDSLGDASEWSEASNFTMASYTLNAPFGLAISPSTYSNTNSFRFTWSTGNARVKNYEYKVGTSSTWTSTNATSVSSLQAYKNGQNIVQVRSVDNAGNRSVASAISYYYDSVAPTVPTNLVATDTTFSWTASTDQTSGVLGYEYKVGDTTSWISTESTLISSQLGLVDGENTLYVRAMDVAGNRSEPASITYTYEDQNLETDSSSDLQMSFTREGSSSPIQSDNIAVKSGESIIVTIPVSEITIEGDTVSQVYIEIDGQKTLLVLDTEKKAYIAKISIPSGKVKGSILSTNQVVEYMSGEKNVKGVNIVIDPYGYIYARSGGKETRLENAKVSLYSYVNGKKVLYVFSDGTKNPQNTNSEGEYSYFVPSGKYVLVVELDGYKTFTSDVFEVRSGAVEQNIGMKKTIPLITYLIGGGVLVLLCVGVLALKKKEIDY